MLFDIPSPESYYARPINLRNPIVFYEGHLPAFSVNTLIKRALGRRGVDERLETLFARGIDPESEAAAQNPNDVWPSRETVRQYAAAADELVLDALANADLERSDPACLRGAEAVFCILEHEPMHHETLLYMFHNMPLHSKRARAPLNGDGSSPEVPAGSFSMLPNELVEIPPAAVSMSAPASRFGWDNERAPEPVIRHTPRFSIQRHKVTNGEFLEFVDAGGYRDSGLWSEEGWEWVRHHAIEHPNFWCRRDEGWAWRSMFELVSLPLDWPVWVTHAEAAAYAKWRGLALPSEAEIMAAWPEAHDASANIDFARWNPAPAAAGTPNQLGVQDIVGNGWEWTRDPFRPLAEDFVPMPSYPEYSADFFDDKHYVMKGGSPATALELVRPTFRNWFRPTYPYVYAAFRCVALQR